MKIYTKTGDKGETSLFGGKRVSKSSLRVEAYGTVDELNSAIGVAIAQVQSSKFKVQSYSLKLKIELEKIQSDLLEIGSILAKPLSFWGAQRLQNHGEDAGQASMTVLKERVEEFEKSIDEMTKMLPELRNFILPGGGVVGSQIHFARTICRRAERRIVELAKKETVDRGILIYFNRLSDLLFTFGRFANHKENQKETVWKKNNS